MLKIIKNLLGLAGIAALITTAFASLRYVNSYSKAIEPTSSRSFSVNGEGKVVALPDIAQFSVGVLTQGGADVGKLQKNNTEKINAIIAFLKSKTIDSKDIKTEQYRIDPQYQYYSNCREVCPPPKIVGYTVTQTVSVKVRDFSKIGDIMTGVVAKGANSVSGLNFTIDDPAKVQDEAREQAIKKAQDKANSIADSAGFKVGRLLTISEGVDVVPLPRFDYGYGGAMTAKVESAPAPTIEPGSQEITVNVSLTYEIQ